MAQGILALVQDAHDADADVGARIENDVALERERQKVGRKFVPLAPEQWLMRQLGQPAVQCVNRNASLFFAPSLKRVIGNRVEVARLAGPMLSVPAQLLA